MCIQCAADAMRAAQNGTACIYHSILPSTAERPSGWPLRNRHTFPADRPRGAGGSMRGPTVLGERLYSGKEGDHLGDILVGPGAHQRHDARGILATEGALHIRKRARVYTRCHCHLHCDARLCGLPLRSQCIARTLPLETSRALSRGPRADSCLGNANLSESKRW